MQFFFNELLSQVRGIWARLDAGQRLVILVVVAATVVGVFGLLWYAGQPSYESVYTARSADDLKQVRQALGTAGIGFRTDDSGFSILVERSRVAAANMAINEAGLRTTGDSGFVGTSIIEDAETKSFKLDAAARAQAASAIGALEGVVSVTVTASRPRRQPFRDQDRMNEPRATVALRLKNNSLFTGIAPAAARMAAAQLMVPLENVDVVNASTHQRWRHDPERDAGSGSMEFLAQQRAMAEERTRLAQEALDQLWPGKTVVTVGVELESTWEIVNQKVLPQDPILKSDRSTKDTSETGQGGAGGDPSATAMANGGGDAAVRNRTSKETTDRNYVTEIGERRSGRHAPGIKRLTVALLYDRVLEQKDGFTKDGLVRTVKAIVGWDPNRDTDDASFSALAADFPPPDTDLVQAEGPGFAARALRFAPAVGQVVAVVLVLLFLRSMMKRPARAPRAAATTAGGTTAAAAGAAVHEEREEDLAPEEQQKRMRREIERAIASDPAALARLLESWLTEQKA